MRKNKKLALLLATMMVAMAFTGCGEKEKETKETVAVETTTAEQAETTGAEGETQEVSDDVFADIFDDVEINGKQVTFPFSLNDLGDEYTIDEEPYNVSEEENLCSYNLYYKDKSIAYIDFFKNDSDNIDRNSKIVRYHTNEDNGTLKIRGIGKGDSESEIINNLPELNLLEDSNSESLSNWYTLGNKTNYIRITVVDNKIYDISIRSEKEWVHNIQKMN